MQGPMRERPFGMGGSRDMWRGMYPGSRGLDAQSAVGRPRLDAQQRAMQRDGFGSMHDRPFDMRGGGGGAWGRGAYSGARGLDAQSAVGRPDLPRPGAGRREYGPMFDRVFDRRGIYPGSRGLDAQSAVGRPRRDAQQRAVRRDGFGPMYERPFDMREGGARSVFRGMYPGSRGLDAQSAVGRPRRDAQQRAVRRDFIEPIIEPMYERPEPIIEPMYERPFDVQRFEGDDLWRGRGGGGEGFRLGGRSALSVLLEASLELHEQCDSHEIDEGERQRLLLDEYANFLAEAGEICPHEEVRRPPSPTREPRWEAPGRRQLGRQ